MLFPTPTLSAYGWHALIVDDSLFHQRLAVRLLARCGLEATVVQNGQQAVVAARNMRFDVILMDVEMPVLDGCDATRQIRAEEANLGIHSPIIGVTSVEDRDRMLTAGMDLVIPKPLSLRALGDTLRELAAESAAC